MDILQPQLFTPPAPPMRHVGDLTPEEWSDMPGRVFHGTFRGTDFQNAPSFHAGDRSAAINRLGAVGNNLALSDYSRIRYYQGSGRNFIPGTHRGHVFAYRMGKDQPVHEVEGTPEKVDPEYGVISGSASPDANANAADVYHWVRQGHGRDTIPSSLLESSYSDAPGSRMISPVIDEVEGAPPNIRTMTPQGLRASRALRKGSVLQYENSIEGGTSAIIPKGASLRTWEDDVLDSPNRSRMEKDFAQQRKDSGKAGMVSFEPVRDFSRDQRDAQLDIFGEETPLTPNKPARVSEVQFSSAGRARSGRGLM
jgi:hypothetical protein